VHVIAAVFANELGDVIGGAHCGGRAASSVLANFCGALSVGHDLVPAVLSKHQPP
jgi:hypothetical protein